MQVRILQSDLMVAALTCDDRDRYNSFVHKFRPALAGHGKALQGYFQRTHGKGGKSALNKYVTTLANEASTRRLAMGTAYCSLARQLFDDVLRLKSAELAGFSVARGIPSESSAPACSIKSAARGKSSSAN